MADDPVETTLERRALMRRVRRSDTGAETATAALLREFGIGYRKNQRKLPGSPDFANIRRRWAIFVNGCFWHHHRVCVRGTCPKTNREFWQRKFADNRSRDARKVRALRCRGIRVMIVWECELASVAALRVRVARFFRSQTTKTGCVRAADAVDHP